MALVTLVQVNDAIRLDLQGAAPTFTEDERTADVLLKIDQAESIVLDFLNPKPEPAWDATTVPKNVSAAIIVAVRCLLDESEENTAILSGLSGVNVNPARNTIAALLWRKRDPVLA